jgi:hypothetical protein
MALMRSDHTVMYIALFIAVVCGVVVIIIGAAR